jgi:hypothetical protein
MDFEIYSKIFQPLVNLTSIYCQECVEIYIHSPSVFMVWCLVKHMDNFTFTITFWNFAFTACF